MNSSGTVSNSAKGTTSSRKISKEQVDAVLDHIASFPCIESHYCREKTKKKYLDSNLNVTKMFDLYVTKCDELRTVPVKESFYRSTFNTKFNLEFFKPKSDICAVCELHKIDASRLNEGVFETHDVLKSTMRELKSKDKESGIPILCFDMQKVITCPKSNIDSSYYLSKLNIYNMTAHLSTTKTVYCAMWNEAAMGRTGNDLVSALYKILERVFSDNDITQLITWSDSCVPQNKNSYMAYAIQHFLKSHPQISSTEMRYSLPGHSCIQEVDNAHSLIERVISRNEFFSPIGLIRLMKTINRKKPYIIIQLNNEDFKNFEIPSKNFNYKAVPFASLRMLGFDNNNLCIVRYNSTYSLENWQEVSIRPTIKYTRVNSKPQKNYQVVWLDPSVSSSKKPIPIAKILDIQKMFQFMGSQDLVYYKTILKIRN